MAHELTPKAGGLPLQMNEIVRRLRDAFAHVELDVDRASQQLEESVRHMRRVGGPHFGAEDIEHTRRSIGRSVYVIVADDPLTDAAYLCFILEPDDEKIFISYESQRHETASRGLRERLARVLDYDIELV